jgi:hypothetical protein
MQETKVVLFEELATKFSLKVPDAIDRINVLVKEGRLTGMYLDSNIYLSDR